MTKDTTISAQRLTRDALRAIDVGETHTFRLPNATACDNGKVVAYQMQNILQCKFSVKTDYANNTLTVTRSTL